MENEMQGSDNINNRNESVDKHINFELSLQGSRPEPRNHFKGTVEYINRVKSINILHKTENKDNKYLTPNSHDASDIIPLPVVKDDVIIDHRVNLSEWRQRYPAGYGKKMKGKEDMKLKRKITSRVNKLLNQLDKVLFSEKDSNQISSSTLPIPAESQLLNYDEYLMLTSKGNSPILSPHNDETTVFRLQDEVESTIPLERKYVESFSMSGMPSSTLSRAPDFPCRPWSRGSVISTTSSLDNDIRAQTAPHPKISNPAPTEVERRLISTAKKPLRRKRKPVRDQPEIIEIAAEVMDEIKNISQLQNAQMNQIISHNTSNIIPRTFVTENNSTLYAAGNAVIMHGRDNDIDEATLLVNAVEASYEHVEPEFKSGTSYLLSTSVDSLLASGPVAGNRHLDTEEVEINSNQTNGISSHLIAPNQSTSELPHLLGDSILASEHTNIQLPQIHNIKSASSLTEHLFLNNNYNLHHLPAIVRVGSLHHGAITNLKESTNDDKIIIPRSKKWSWRKQKKPEPLVPITKTQFSGPVINRIVPPQSLRKLQMEYENRLNLFEQNIKDPIFTPATWSGAQFKYISNI